MHGLIRPLTSNEMVSLESSDETYLGFNLGVSYSLTLPALSHSLRLRIESLGKLCPGGVTKSESFLLALVSLSKSIRDSNFGSLALPLLLSQ